MTSNTAAPSGDGSLEAASKLQDNIDQFRSDGTGAGVFEYLASREQD